MQFLLGGPGWPLQCDSAGEPCGHPPFDAAPRRPALAVLCLRLDGLAAERAGRGPLAGDAMQHLTAQRLTRAVGAADVVNPLEGGEIACLLHGLPSREQLSRLAWRLLDAASTPDRPGTGCTVPQPSIGIATWPADGTTFETLFGNAAAAMCRARRQKSGFAFFDAKVDVWDAEAR